MQLQRMVKDFKRKVVNTFIKVESKLYFKSHLKMKKDNNVEQIRINFKNAEQVFCGGISKRRPPIAIRVNEGELQGDYYLILKRENYVFYYNADNGGIIALGKTDWLLRTILKARRLIANSKTNYQFA